MKVTIDTEQDYGSTGTLEITDTENPNFVQVTRYVPSAIEGEDKVEVTEFTVDIDDLYRAAELFNELKKDRE